MSLIIIDSFGLPKNKRFENIINVFEKITKKTLILGPTHLVQTLAFL